MTHFSGASMFRISRLMSLLAGLLSLIVVLLIPALYFFFAFHEIRQTVRADAAYIARTVERNVQERPEMWEFEYVRLLEIASAPSVSGVRLQRTLLNAGGAPVVQTPRSEPRPVLTAEASFYDSGRLAGVVLVSHSLRPELYRTGLAALLSLFAGLGLYSIFKIFPISMLHDTLRGLQTEKKKTEVTLNAIEDGVIAVNAEDRILLINRAAENILGVQAAGVLGRPLENVYAPEHQKMLLPGKRGNLCTLRTPGGQSLTVEEMISQFPSDGAEGGGMVIAFRDVTLRMQTEAELLRARQLESLGVLAGGIAHDFNNYLQGILGNVSLAQFYSEDNLKAKSRLEEAEKIIGRARELAAKLLTFSKGGSPVVRVSSVAEIVRDAAQFAVRGTGVAFRLRAEPGIWNAEIDPGQITQAVSNIVINAVQAIRGSGTIRVAIRNAVLEDTESLHLRAGKYVVIEIEDSGPGIPEDVISRIFDPYFTTKETGSGLGLTTAYSIAKAHGGTLSAESRAGGGALFTLYIPATEARPEEQKKALSPVPVAPRSKRVLVMDDEEMIRDVATGILEHLGYDAVTCENGTEAVDAYLQHLAQGRPFDAVIMDLTVPGGLGGKEAAAIILGHHRDACLIASSGYSNDPVFKNPAEFGFRSVVAKPYLPQDLAAVLQRTLA